MASGVPAVKYEWFHNGMSLAGHSDAHVAGGNLTIPKVLKQHAGMYQCVARNRHGEIIMTVHISVASKLFRSHILLPYVYYQLVNIF